MIYIFFNMLYLDLVTVLEAIMIFFFAQLIWGNTNIHWGDIFLNLFFSWYLCVYTEFVNGEIL